MTTKKTAVTKPVKSTLKKHTKTPNINAAVTVVAESVEPIKMENAVDETEQTDNSKFESSIISGPEFLEIKEQLKAQLLNEMKNEHVVAMEQAKFRRQEEDNEHSKYIEKMKLSPDPWVDIIGWVRTDEGVKIELEWNGAFVDYLRANGITGSDEDQVVQKWVTLLLRDMADKMEERYGGDFK